MGEFCRLRAYSDGMKISSISGYTCYVQDLDKTAAFYETLGFRPGKRDGNTVTMYVNWFSVTFVSAPDEDKPGFQKEAHAEPRGSGLYINIKVVGVDDFYQMVLDKGMKPSSEPHDWPHGTREFVLRDPDGYKLVFFEKK
jgi:catechol 2,3-dioxygenase-like lactoylglutathione lyase family enzyme